MDRLNYLPIGASAANTLEQLDLLKHLGNYDRCNEHLLKIIPKLIQTCQEALSYKFTFLSEKENKLYRKVLLDGKLDIYLDPKKRLEIVDINLVKKDEWTRRGLIGILKDIKPIARKISEQKKVNSKQLAQVCEFFEDLYERSASKATNYREFRMDTSHLAA